MSARKGLSDIVRELDDENISPKLKLELLNRLIEGHKDLHDPSFTKNEEFVRGLRMLLVNPARTIRTAALKVLRLYCKKREFVEQIVVQNLHYFIVRSLEKQHAEAERAQALKLIRQIMLVECSLVPRSFVQGLKAIAEGDDPYNRICLDTLCEIGIRNPKAFAHCNGLKTLLLSLVDPLLESIQESLLIPVLHILDEDKNRSYVRPGADLRILLAPLTETFPTEVLEKDKEKKWRAVTKATIRLLRSWTGVISLAADSHALRNMIDALYLPSLDLKDIILDALYEIFRIAIPKQGADPFKHDLVRNDKDSGFSGEMELSSRPLKSRHNLLDNYISALLIAFIHHGLIEALIEVGNGVLEDYEIPPPQPVANPQAAQQPPPQPEKVPATPSLTTLSPAVMRDVEKLHKYVNMKSLILLGELLHLSNTLLPTSQCARLQTLPKLVKHAAAFNLDARVRSRSSSMITALHQYAHLQSSTSDEHSVATTGSNRWKRTKGKDRRLDKIDDVKLRIDIQMDEATFQSKIRETQVTITKDYTKWNWDIISDLLEGPLNNPSHVTTACRNKFAKRLLSFLRPSKKMFIHMSWTNQNTRYTRMGCRLLELLLSCEIGTSYLEGSPLIPEIHDLLKMEVEIKDKTQSPLTSQRILRTMVREYFVLLGVLSSIPKGSDMMIKFKIFDQLLLIAEMGRDDLTNYIMNSLDYNIQTESCPSRVLLGKALVSSSSLVRMRATRILRTLLRSGAHNFADWGVTFLVRQLSEDQQISRESLSILDEACDDVRCLESLIAKKTFHNLNKAGRDLILVRFLSTPEGFKYLSEETTFIQEELGNWRKMKYINYVVNLDTAISEAFSTNVWRKKLDQGDTSVHLPPHFYGELVKTTLGCSLLKTSGHFLEYLEILKSTSFKPVERRAALWVMGHIGASTLGLKFLQDASVIPYIVDLAEKSDCLSLRGTCFYVLGLLSSTEQGREILDSLDWESDPNSLICVPRDLSTSGFYLIPQYNYRGSWSTSNSLVPLSSSSFSTTNGSTPASTPQTSPHPSSSSTSSSTSPEQQATDLKDEILLSVINISNHISAETAGRNLKKLKGTNPEIFLQPALALEVFRLMEIYFYRILPRRFLYDLFSSVIFSQKDFLDFSKRVSLHTPIGGDDQSPYLQSPHQNEESLTKYPNGKKTAKDT